MKSTVKHLVAASALAALQPGFAQGVPLRPDAVEVKRIAALAKVQRLAITARSSYDPKLQYSAPGQKGCTFNIGDLASADAGSPDGATTSAGKPSRAKGVARIEYITLVEATPICVQR